MTDPATRRHRLAETVEAYGIERVDRGHTKLSISLPAELAEEVRLAAAATGLGVSAVIAAAIRGSIASADQARLDRALALDADANLARATDALASTARAWADLEW